MSVAGYGISAAYNYWNSIQPKSTITQNAGYVNPDGTGGRLGQEMAGAATNSRSGGCIKAPVDYGGSNTQIATYYPSNDGAVYGIKQNIILNKGTILDRYGTPNCNYFSEPNIPVYKRAMPCGKNLNNYHQYEVLKPFVVESSTIAPAFGQLGGGIQYHTYSKVYFIDLYLEGFISRNLEAGLRMNCNELVKALYDKEIPSTWYSINGLYKEDAYVLRKIKKSWEVFSVDDYGNQNNDYVLFDNEQEACEYLYKKLLEMKQIL